MKNKTILFILQFSIVMFIIKYSVQFLGHIHESHSPLYNFETIFSNNLYLSWGVIILATMSIMCFPIFTKLVFDRINNAVYIKYIFPLRKDKFITTVKNIYGVKYVQEDYIGRGGYNYYDTIKLLRKPNSVNIKEYNFYSAMKWIRDDVIDQIDDFLNNPSQSLLEIPLISNKIE